MGTSDGLIDFSVSQTRKENIQFRSSGRSAKTLANLLSPLSSKSQPLSNKEDLKDIVRAEFEKEAEGISEADDPLDIYDRYVKWTLDAYPSHQATPQSQLLPLLERCTSAFLHTSHYKNDPRYLKLWLLYIRFFSDAPHEKFAFLARHGIGDGLALYYEEFAAWLESAGRWSRAEAIFMLGLRRSARPVERLQRKFGEFQQRYEKRPKNGFEPSSPALPIIRPALATKVDPFSTSGSQAPDAQTASRVAGTTANVGRPKLANFSDADEPIQPALNNRAKEWEKIGSLAGRKKENTMEARPGAGEILKAAKSNTGVPKMMVFRDQVHPSREQQVLNPKTGRCEFVFVNLEAVYPHPEDPSIEYCFEELRSRHRGWLDRDKEAERMNEKQDQEVKVELQNRRISELQDDSHKMEANRSQQQLASGLEQSLAFEDVKYENKENAPWPEKDSDHARRLRREDRANKTRKIRLMEVKSAPQTIQINIDSPTGPKLKQKKPAEPTMTLYTKAATDAAYEIVNQALKSADQNGIESGDESSEDEYTSGDESTGTGRISGTTSEYREETGDEMTEVGSLISDTTDVKSITESSEFKDSEDMFI